MKTIPRSVVSFYKTHPIKRFKVFGKQIEYIRAGKGRKTILIIPGGGQTAQSNFALIEALEQKFRVIALTIYDIHSVDEFCLIINALLKLEKIYKVHLYGLSIGGLLAQSYLWRNYKRVESIIISHACTPESKTYKNKIIRPLKMLGMVLPLTSNRLIQYFAKSSAGKIQGWNKNMPIDETMSKPRNKELTNYFVKEFYEKYFTKILLKSWVSIHTDFYRNEKFTMSDLHGWSGKVLILRTDNDPLMQDEGYFAKLYPEAQVHTFYDTGHLTFYYQYTKMLKVINQFLFSHTPRREQLDK